MSIVDNQEQASRDSDFAHHPGDGKHILLGSLSLLAVWAIVLFGGWRLYVYTFVGFALFMGFLNRRKLPGRISSAVRNWRATWKSSV